MARHRIDPDAEFDATACARKLLQGTPEPSSAPQTAWTPPEPAPRRTRRSQGRTHGPDSIRGLVDYFTRACPPLSWAGTLEIGNRQALMAIFSELRNDVGLSPDDCRAMVDLYVTRLAGRAPTKPYVWDFKWRRYELLRALRGTGVTVTDAEYESWNTTATTDRSEDESFAASWENP
ncbi:hypothetical protein ACLGIH_20035 [Streptomyces sp. HMX87]|uniref:hypothetical protein n=1 Tax=Streptomyces sp. HMX87 TaxID=3390849 RepID=UPI003A877AFA